MTYLLQYPLLKASGTPKNLSQGMRRSAVTCLLDMTGLLTNELTPIMPHCTRSSQQDQLLFQLAALTGLNDFQGGEKSKDMKV